MAPYNSAPLSYDELSDEFDYLLHVLRDADKELMLRGADLAPGGARYLIRHALIRAGVEPGPQVDYQASMRSALAHVQGVKR
jgi:hypothetical protein